MIDGTVRARAVVLAQPAEVRERIRLVFDRLAREYVHPAGVEVPVSIRMAAGRRAPG